LLSAIELSLELYVNRWIYSTLK